MTITEFDLSLTRVSRIESVPGVEAERHPTPAPAAAAPAWDPATPFLRVAGDEAGHRMALDWLAREFAPVMLDIAGRAREATRMRSLPRIECAATEDVAGAVAHSLGMAGPGWRWGTLWERGWTSAWHRAVEPLWTLGWSVASNAGGSHCRAHVVDGILQVATGASKAAPWSAAQEHRRSIAHLAATTAYGAALWMIFVDPEQSAWDAALSVARDALEPATAHLHASAQDLHRRLCTTQT